MRLHVDELTSFLTGGEYYNAVNKGEKGVILAHTDIEAWMVDCATLTLEDVSSLTVRTTKNLHSKSFAF